MQKWQPWRLILGATVAVWLVAGPAGSMSVSASSAASSTTASTTAAETHHRSVPPAPTGSPPRGPVASGRGFPPGGPGAPHGPGPARGIAGTVVGLSGSGFTMTVAGATYRVAVSPSAVYVLAPGWTTSSSTLAVGDQVSVRGSVSGNQITAAGVQIRLSGITAKTTGGSGDSTTVIEPNGRTATLQFASAADLPTGRKVQAEGKWQGDTLEVQAYRILPDQIDGRVTALGTKDATVQTRQGAIVTVKWSTQTTFAAGPKQTADASQVVVGAHVHAQGVLSGNALQATVIDLGPGPLPPHRPMSS